MQPTRLLSAGRRWASQQVKVTLQPGETQRVIFVLGYQENPVDDKFDPPGSQTINKRRALPTIRRYTQPEQVDAGFRSPAPLLERAAGHVPGRIA